MCIQSILSTCTEGSEKIIKNDMPNVINSRTVKSSNFKKVLQISASISTYMPRYGSFPVNAMRSPQAKKTATAPTCHCQIYTHGHIQFGMATKIMLQGKRTASTQLSQFKKWWKRSVYIWNASTTILIREKKITTTDARPRKRRRLTLWRSSAKKFSVANMQIDN